MSYYRPSFSQTVAMARGRGFSSRGSNSYRGNSSRGSSSWGGGGGGRGYNSNRGGERGGGRFTSSFSSPFESRSKYPPVDRYSGGGRSHSDDYRKSYRSEQSGGYSGRENSGHRSPERKRIRTEAPSSRHENSGYGSSNDSYNASRYESAGGYSERRSFSNDRRPAPFSRRDEFRKPSGPPPSSSPRGGYRGRISTRGSRGLRLRDRPIRRRLVENSYAVRKRVVTARSTNFARRLKISRLRSAAIRRALKKKSSIKTDSEEEKSDEDNKDEDEDIKNESQENGDLEDIDKPDENEHDVVEEKKTPSPKKEKEAASEKEDKKEESDAEEKARKNRFIKLTCPHCGTRCPTFSKYSLHLQSSKHMAAMRRVAIKQKSILAQMRLTQRNTQREVEKTTEDLAPRTSFCPLCKLNYKQPKATHQSSDSHKNMKKFLMPYCKICRITFKSPMLFENHLCSIEHIKRKSRFEANGENDSNEEDNLENFMTIDSVGDVDDEEGGTGTVEPKKEEGSDSSTTKPKEKINVGIEQVRKVEVYYCDLCRMYLPRVDDAELQRVLTTHCKQRTHLRQYVRYKEDKDLAKHAERLQRKETAEKESREKKIKEEKDAEKKEGDNKTKGEAKEEKEKGVTEEDAGDDKLWASVDKDLGDLLAEAESGNKSSDEDDDSHATGERYDRYSEKNGDEKKAGDDDKGEKDVAVKTEQEKTDK